MALSEDQKAMLRLLAQRGEQGYEDLAALMGIEVGAVHAKALEAAAELESEGIPAPAIPAPPGVAAPDNPPPVKPPEPAKEPASSADTAPERPAPKAATKPKRTPPQRPQISLPGSGGARAAILAGVGVVILLVVVLVIGGGDSDGTDGTGTETTASEQAANGAGSSQLTQAVLSPIDGGDGKGLAVFGRIRKNVVLQVQAEGLEPSPQGSSYTIWLYKSPRLALRVGSVKVTESGGIASQFPVPTELLAYIASGAFDQIDVSLTSDAAYRAEIAKAKKEERLPAYTGAGVLRGPITGPAIDAANRTRE